jgi:hypothetical protein
VICLLRGDHSARWIEIAAPRLMHLVEKAVTTASRASSLERKHRIQRLEACAWKLDDGEVVSASNCRTVQHHHIFHLEFPRINHNFKRTLVELI